MEATQETDSTVKQHLDQYADQKKHIKEFKETCEELDNMIKDAREDLVQIHKSMNNRDSKLVQDITQQIDDIVHSIITLDK